MKSLKAEHLNPQDFQSRATEKKTTLNALEEALLRKSKDDCVFFSVLPSKSELS